MQEPPPHPKFLRFGPGFSTSSERGTEPGQSRDAPSPPRRAEGQQLPRAAASSAPKHVLAAPAARLSLPGTRSATDPAPRLPGKEARAAKASPAHPILNYCFIFYFWHLNAKLSFLPSYDPARRTGMRLSGQRGERQKRHRVCSEQRSQLAVLEGFCSGIAVTFLTEPYLKHGNNQCTRANSLLSAGIEPVLTKPPLLVFHRVSEIRGLSNPWRRKQTNKQKKLKRLRDGRLPACSAQILGLGHSRELLREHSNVDPTGRELPPCL